MTPHRAAAHPRVFRRLLETTDVALTPRVLSKATLTELSHVLENAVIAHDLPGAVFTGFQRSSNWLRALERYQRLVAPRARSVAVFAAGNLDTMAEDDIVRIPLAEDHPLVEEWFLIVLTPRFAAALLGEDTGAPAAQELDRTFEAVWSFDAATVTAIARHIQQEVADLDGTAAARIDAALATYPPGDDDSQLRDEITSDLIVALETGRERYRVLAERERRTADELRELDRSKNAFLSAVSHELRTPLTVVHGLAATLERLGGQLSPADRTRIEASLATHTERLAELLDDLLDLDRLSRGTATTEPEELDTVEVVRGAIDALAGAHRVRLDAPASLPAVLDRTQLERIVANLVDNADKYAPDGPIEVTLTGDATTVEVTVEDRGPGIPEQGRAQILEPFHRLDHAAAQPGTGVGLALVAEFVHLQEGELRVEDRPGGGARFVVRLPAQPAD